MCTEDGKKVHSGDKKGVTQNYLIPIQCTG